MRRQEIITIKANLLAINKSLYNWIGKFSTSSRKKIKGMGSIAPMVLLAWKKSNDFAIEFDGLTKSKESQNGEIGCDIFLLSLITEPQDKTILSFDEMGKMMAEIKSLIRFDGQNMMVAWKYQYKMSGDFFYGVYLPMVKAVMALAEIERKGERK